MYRLDGKLIAIGVVDILPKCVSSVYFIYDPEWQKYSFGKVTVHLLHRAILTNSSHKLSALRETLLAQEIHETGVPEMTSLYMGKYFQIQVDASLIKWFA
jgi:arginine-tRNA-protein transferase